MKELTNQEKIKLLEGVLKKPTHYGLCYRIMRKAYCLVYITEKDCCESNVKIVSTLIPEFLMLKPLGEVGNRDYWFGEPSGKNIPLRQAKLEELIEIIKSKQHETL